MFAAPYRRWRLTPVRRGVGELRRFGAVTCGYVTHGLRRTPHSFDPGRWNRTANSYRTFRLTSVGMQDRSTRPGLDVDNAAADAPRQRGSACCALVLAAGHGHLDGPSGQRLVRFLKHGLDIAQRGPDCGVAARPPTIVRCRLVRCRLVRSLRLEPGRRPQVRLAQPGHVARTARTRCRCCWCRRWGSNPHWADLSRPDDVSGGAG